MRNRRLPASGFVNFIVEQDVREIRRAFVTNRREGAQTHQRRAVAV